ncbi:MAG TPA: sugar ABC transporter permease [Bacilli bacterium]|nr:sugar ABC transporter permease [Bacilli bacterium]HPK67993.1 sugar ABC transporter permease [Bacilli bacterium]
MAKADKTIKSYKATRTFDAIWSNLLAFILVALWMIPVLWIVASAFSTQIGYISTTFFPTSWTFDNFVDLFTKTKFPQWLLNTTIIAIANTVLTTFFTTITAYILSRFRFKSRKLLMNISLILGMFPGFMAMIAVYLILSMFNLIGSIWALLIYYVAGAGLGFFTCKGYFDTLPKDIDESAYLDGASHLRIFFQIFLPLAKPMLIYTALLAFMAPWADYILASLVLTSDASKTVAVGLYSWMDSTMINVYFTKFAAGCVVVAIPIVTLYIFLQKFFIEGISAGAVKG